jgi:hypothetical protein
MFARCSPAVVARMMPLVVGLTDRSVTAASNCSSGTAPSFCQFDDCFLEMPLERKVNSGAPFAGLPRFTVFASNCPAFRSARSLISQARRSASVFFDLVAPPGWPQTRAIEPGASGLPNSGKERLGESPRPNAGRSSVEPRRAIGMRPKTRREELAGSRRCGR